MNNQLLLTTKSIMYKIIALDCGVYIDDWDEFIVSALLCSDCRRPWNNSRTECFFCGSNNFHVYRCDSCGKLISLTTATRKCDVCGGKLSKVCLNPNCVTNTDPKLREFLNKNGGVFEKGKTAAILNEMRCKMCGCKSSIYETKRFKIVDSFSELDVKPDVVYLQKLSEASFNTKHNGKLEHFTTIFEILEHYLNINYDLD